jgi:glycosyltransferase involved in cell wall biosynthesis
MTHTCEEHWHVGVVIPACNEEDTIGACLQAILESLDACRSVGTAYIVVVADSCQDRTVAVARSLLNSRGRVLECRARSAGVARGMGVAEVLRHFQGVPHSRLWIANTDADSQPHADWIIQQLALAARDYCAVAGIVHVDALKSERPDVIGEYVAEYIASLGDSHPHVHGANLGVRADAYLDAGGWSTLALAEDHCLWNRVRERGWPIISSLASVVLTSARLRGRATGGFADLLRCRADVACA